MLVFLQMENKYKHKYYLRKRCNHKMEGRVKVSHTYTQHKMYITLYTHFTQIESIYERMPIFTSWMQ